MDLEDRLRELLSAGERSQADLLAKGALASQTITSLELRESGVRLETKSFVGTHNITPALKTLKEHANDPDQDTTPANELDIHSTQYHFKGDNLDYTLSKTSVPREEIIECLTEKGYLTAPDDETPPLLKLATPVGAPEEPLNLEKPGREPQKNVTHESPKRASGDGTSVRSVFGRVMGIVGISSSN